MTVSYYRIQEKPLMKQYRKNYQLKNAAKDRLDGRYGGAVLLTLLQLIITGAVSMLINRASATAQASVYAGSGSGMALRLTALAFDLLLTGANIICAVLNAGAALYFLNLACGQPLSVSDLFYGFRQDSRKALTIAAAQVLCRVVPLLPGQYLLQHALNTGSALWYLAAAAALLAGLCIYVPVSLGLFLSFYLMFDFPEYSGKETLALSWRIMKGQRSRLFWLQLSFLPLILLGILSFGIGFLWLEPYMQLTYTQFFLNLMNPDCP